MLALVQKLVQSVGGMDGLVFFSGVFPSILEDDLGTAGMFWEKFSHIVGASMDDDPARVGIIVLGDFLAGQLDRLRIVASVVHVDDILDFDQDLGECFNVATRDKQEST